MAAETCVLSDRSHPLSLNADINSAAKCVSCHQKQRQLNDILLQLKSLQKIVDMLQQDSSFEYGKDFSCLASDNWTNVPSKRQYSEHKVMKSSNNHLPQSVECVNIGRPY
jgi:hypothetical protein